MVLLFVYTALLEFAKL